MVELSTEIDTKTTPKFGISTEPGSVFPTPPTLDIDISTHFWAGVNALLFVCILGGNILTIIAVRTCRRLRAIISNTFILSLAISDLIVGLALPYHVAFYMGWNLGDSKILCLFRFFLMIFACCVSLGTLICIAIDRYIAIVYALHYRRYMTRRVAYLIIALNWCIGAIIGSIPVFWNNWNTASHCEFDEILPPGYVVGIITPAFILIWTFMLLIYWRIMREASKQARQLAPCGNSDWKSIQIVVLIMGCFTICWLPYFIVVLTETFHSPHKTTIVYKYALTLATCNSGINPVIYAWKNSNYRKAFVRILCCRSPNCHLHDLEANNFQSISKIKIPTPTTSLSSTPSTVQNHIIILPLCDQATTNGDCPKNAVQNITTHQQVCATLSVLRNSLQQNLNFDLKPKEINA